MSDPLSNLESMLGDVLGDTATETKPRKKPSSRSDSRKSAKRLTEVEAEIESDHHATRASERAKAKQREALLTEKQKSIHYRGVEYAPRLLNVEDENVTTDIEALLATREAYKMLPGGRRLHVLLQGPPGCGKTAGTYAAFQDDVVRLACHETMDETAFIGTWAQQPGGTFAWVDGPLTVAMREGKVLLVDDFTIAPPGALSVLYPAMDEGRITFMGERLETVEAADGFMVVGAHNPNIQGTYLPEPLLSRFQQGTVMEYNTDYAVAERLGVPKRMLLVSSKLNQEMAAGAVTWAPQMREMLAFRDLEKVFGEKYAAASLVAGAPESAREALLRTMKAHFPDLQPLAVKQSAAKTK